MQGVFPPCSSLRGEMITELGVNVGRKIYPIAGPQCTGYPDDGGVRPTLRFETPPALKREERREKRRKTREKERERERKVVGVRVRQEVNLCRVLQLL